MVIRKHTVRRSKPLFDEPAQATLVVRQGGVLTVLLQRGGIVGGGHYVTLSWEEAGAIAALYHRATAETTKAKAEAYAAAQHEV